MIFAFNHPTAFIDSILMPTIMPYRKHIFHFITRGDHFRKPIYAWMMRQINMVPIFRAQEGYQDPRRNDKTFKHCYDVLARKKHRVMIMSEGLALNAKRLKKVKKGTAWMALGAAEDHGLEDVCIVPIGLTYENSNQIRSTIMIDVGEVIEAKDYLEDFREDRMKAVAEMTEDLTEQLRKHMIHVEQPEDEEMVDQILSINLNGRKEPFFPTLSRDRSLFSASNRIAEAVNQMNEEDKELLRERLENYQLALATAGVSDKGFSRRKRFSFGNTLLLLLGLIPFLLGFALMAWPWYVGQYIANKRIRSRYLEFYASIRLAVSLGYMLIYLIVTTVLALIFLGWWGLLIPAGLILLGYIALWYRDLWKEWRAAAEVRRLTGEQVERLELLREALLSLVIG